MFRRGRGRWEERTVHEYAMVDGRIDVIKHVLPHENLKGIDAFLERHVRYARMEAGEIGRAADGGADHMRIRDLIGSPAKRRRALKTKVWYRLPARPAIRFLWNIMIRGGFLDGRQGLVYAELIAAYEAMIDAVRLEDRLGSAGRPVLAAPPMDVRTLLVCPTCHSDLAWSAASAACVACRQIYPVVDGIPVLVESSGGTDINHDEIDHKTGQANHLNRLESQEFEIVRPRGSPRWHRFLLREKLRRASSAFRTSPSKQRGTLRLRGFRYGRGELGPSWATVISADISLGAARRAAARARRFGSPFTRPRAPHRCPGVAMAA